MTSIAGERYFPGAWLTDLQNDWDQVAFEDGSRHVSCGDLLGLVMHLARALRAAGVERGSGIGILPGVNVEGFAVNMAAHELGCKVIGIRPGWSPSQLTAVLDRGVDAMVGDPTTLTTELRSAIGAAASPVAVLSVGAHPGAIDLMALGPPGFEVDAAGQVTSPPVPAEAEGTGTASAVWEAPVVEAEPDDVARINFTSGSTGLPKGCVRDYRTFSRLFEPDCWAPDLARLVGCFERFLVHASFAHPVVLTFGARSITIGGTVVVPDAATRSRLADAIEQHGITGAVVPVPLLQQLLADLRERPRDLQTLRALVVTGSPASPALLSAATEQLGPVLWQGYGQAESGMISLLAPDDVAASPEQALASVGRVLPEVDVRVVDPGSGRPVASGEVGEICVRSPHVMSGYWHDPEQTREVLRDGWLHTRDLGRVDGDGFLYLTGRIRDVVMVNAEVCYAGAVERTLARHPDVEQAYVVGVPDEQTGEAIHAFVVPVTGRPAPDLDAVAPLVLASLTPNHLPKTVNALTEVPTLANGKPDKQALTELVH